MPTSHRGVWWWLREENGIRFTTNLPLELVDGWVCMVDLGFDVYIFADGVHMLFTSLG
jgi:hypothetical protein